MTKFHTTVSRRDFMKGLGLAGAGISGAAMVAPEFHDLDELTSQKVMKDSWYVKRLDPEELSVDIDWQIYKRIDRTRQVMGKRFPIAATSSANVDLHQQIKATRDLQASGHNINYLKERFSNYNGPSLRDLALTGASSATRLDYPDFLGNLNQIRGSRMGEDLDIQTPEQQGYAKWSGTPEDNLRMLRNAARFFGGTDIGVIELTPNLKKLFHLNTTSGKPINFKDVDSAEDNNSEIVIPNKAKYIVHVTTLEPTDQVRQAPGPTYTGYDLYPMVSRRLAYFLRSLGYMNLRIDSYTGANGVGAFAGVFEHSRACMVGTSPRFGNLGRGNIRFLTDLPLVATNPIDAGIARFCNSCKSCAIACPYEALPMGDASWEHENDPEEEVQNYVPGWKGWRLYNFKCPRCKNCHGECPFNGASEAMVHEIIRATAAVTPLFNGFFAEMHRTFDYGTRNPVEWWDRDVPTGTIEPTYTKVF